MAFSCYFIRVMIRRFGEMVRWSATVRCITAAAIVAASIVTAGTAAAQDRDRLWNQCVVHDEHGNIQAGTSPDLAIGAYTAIIESGQETTKGLAATFLNRGRAYASKGNYDRAIQDFDQAIRLDPNNPVAFFSRGNVYARQGEYDHAIDDFDQAIRLDPNLSTRRFLA
jgi:tetratricopeptide (TPR) repeat protein